MERRKTTEIHYFLWSWSPAVGLGGGGGPPVGSGENHAVFQRFQACVLKVKRQDGKS
jgi:hypothetical protein